MEQDIKEKTSLMNGQLAIICGSLGHLYKEEYLIEPNCLDGVKNLIRLLKRDDATHVSRRCMGEMNIVKNHLIHIIKNCPLDTPDLFNITLRLLINVTTPPILLFGEVIPREKIERHFYLTLVGHDQNYKLAFDDVEFWNKICRKLTDLFEIDWAERSADDGIEIERILTLIRNVVQIPGNVEDEKLPDNDATIHDKVLQALRQSQILQLILLVSSNKNEEQYYLNLLEIFSLLLREQNPKVLAHCDAEQSEEEKNQDAEDLLKVREIEKNCKKNYSNTRNFKSTFVMRGVKSAANLDIVCHKSLSSLSRLNLGGNANYGQQRKKKLAVASQHKERRSTFEVRLLLKEFCLQFLKSGFFHFMNAVKNRLDSGKSLTHDQTYYFWAITFFFKFAIEANVNVDLIKNCLSIELFHFIQTSIEHAFENLKAEKNDTVNWVKRIHLILKAYQSLLETLRWMDCSKTPLVRAISREIKSDLFYVVEYREMTFRLLLKYDPEKFSISYLSDLIQTVHLFIKLLEEFSKNTKLIVQKITKKRKLKKHKRIEEGGENIRKKWEEINDDLYDCLVFQTSFPEIPPFDAALDISIEDQKERAMKNIQKLLFKGEIKEAIGLLRSSRQVWPENNYFGHNEMTVEDEMTALQDIFLANLGYLEDNSSENQKKEVNEEVSDYDNDSEDNTKISEQYFEVKDYIYNFAHKKVVECCVMLLKNYKKNSDHVNYCVLKLLHRIGWECSMPALLYQASLFWTLLKIMNDEVRQYDEINKFTINLLRKFRKHATKNHIVFLELLFWKNFNVAMEIQHSYEQYRPKKPSQKKKSISEEEKNDLNQGTKKRKKTKCGSNEVTKEVVEVEPTPVDVDVCNGEEPKRDSKKNKDVNKESLLGAKPKRRRKSGSGKFKKKNDVTPNKESRNYDSLRRLSDEFELNSDPGIESHENDYNLKDNASLKNELRARLFSDEEEDFDGKETGQKPSLPSNAQNLFAKEPESSEQIEKDEEEDEEYINGSKLSQEKSSEKSQDSFKTKRRKYISSDSETEDLDSNLNKSIFTGKRRKPAIIDSDSD